MLCTIRLLRYSQKTQIQIQAMTSIGEGFYIGHHGRVIIHPEAKIGSDVLIAPLTYVNFDVPDHSIVIGNPGRIIPKENAVEGYLCNCV